MPDVTMFPAIAFFFEISIDELFDYDRMKLEEKKKEKYNNFQTSSKRA